MPSEKCDEKDTQCIAWEFQYRRQYTWLNDTRKYLYREVDIARSRKVLEAGCSIALVAEELRKRIDGTVVGIDVDIQALGEAKMRDEKLLLVCGDIYNLPFKRDTFDCVLFQFFLLWLKRPLNAIRAMINTISPGGWLLAMAEPDYGGRIDFPSAVNNSSVIQKKLREEGANPLIGRELEFLFREASLENVKWGISSIPFGIKLCRQNFEDEWRFIELLSKTDNKHELKAMRRKEKNLLDQGRRAYFAPVFHCSGRKKQ